MRTVSILIPCHNAERWIAGCIESALSQTWHEKEVIVIDDGSTDGSLAIIQGFGSRIQWESGPNRGGNATRNRLLELAGGEWLQYLDADDYLLPDKIWNQMDYLSSTPDTDVIYGPVTMEYHEGTNTCRELLPIPEPHDPWVLLARWFLPQTGAPLWRKGSIISVGAWKVDQPCCQEHELYLRLLMAGKRFAYCSNNGAIYRQWSDQTVCKRDKTQVRDKRLDIEQRIENFLRANGLLTPIRHWAINQARFELARGAWAIDKQKAKEIMNTIVDSQPDFAPSGAAAPKIYRWLFLVFGFGLTERIAGYLRKTRQQVA